MFWDTSAFVKCYGGLEPGHARARSLLFKEKGHKGSSLLWPESVSAIVRKLGPNRRLRESLLRLCEDHLKHFDLVPLDQAHMESAVRLIRKHGLRAADALHLAAALMLSREMGRARFRFATSDALQGRAARAEGLKVLELPA
jgi:predicted nucleic acid-binding protein